MALRYLLFEVANYNRAPLEVGESMASMFKKTMLYLGLAPDDEYDGTFEAASSPDPTEVRVVPRTVGVQGGDYEPHGQPQLRTVRAVPITPQPLPRRDDDRPRTSVVKPLPKPPSKPANIAPRSFDDLQEVGDRFKEHQPVILDLLGVDRDLSRRMIDFASGVCYALNGKMEKINSATFLLTPRNFELDAEDRRDLGVATR